MEFRSLLRDEIRKFYELDRREIVKQIYRHKNGELELVDDYFDIPDWSYETKTKFIQTIEALHDRSGTVFGAFDKQKHCKWN